MNLQRCTSLLSSVSCAQTALIASILSLQDGLGENHSDTSCAFACVCRGGLLGLDSFLRLLIAGFNACCWYLWRKEGIKDTPPFLHLADACEVLLPIHFWGCCQDSWLIYINFPAWLKIMVNWDAIHVRTFPNGSLTNGTCHTFVRSDFCTLSKTPKSQ